MKKFGYENSIPKYEMVNKFYSKRTPMIILIFGAPCIGKSLIANNLAERLNVSNVL
jgi:2-phosphoglycerate kinase